MTTKHFLQFVVILAMALSSFSNADTPVSADNTTGIEGVISISPVQGGPTRLDVPDSKPLADTTWTVKNEKGSVTSFTTDAQGKFKVSLPPGHYTVSKDGGGRSIGRFGPFEVDVTAGKMTSVEWKCDSGIR